MADPKPLLPRTEGEPESDETDAARVRAAIGAGLRKFYDQVAEEPIPPDWLVLVGAKPDEPGS